MICLVGVNGAGKSTYYREKLAHLQLPFLNADVLAKELWPDEPDAHAYEAGRQIAQQRQALIEQGKSFVTETVFSHPSKLELLEMARSYGYRVWLVYIHLSEAELAIKRVEERVSRGGHPVPPEKIELRYQRLLQQVKVAIRGVDRALLFDNSWHGRPFKHIATLNAGVVQKAYHPLPAWARELLGS